MSRVGGLPSRITRQTTKIRSTVPRAKPATWRERFLKHIHDKGALLHALDKQPLVLGVPLATTRTGVAVDVGLKNPATISVRELYDASPYVKEKLLEHALNLDDHAPPPNLDLLLRDCPPIVLALVCTEDVMAQPIATAVHPHALHQSIPADTLDALMDPFFSTDRHANRAKKDELFKLLVDAVPDADEGLTAIQNQREAKRADFRRSIGVLSASAEPPALSDENLAKLQAYREMLAQEMSSFEAEPGSEASTEVGGDDSEEAPPSDAAIDRV